MVRKRFKLFVVAMALAVTLPLVVIRPAHAYIDPGTGSIILQSLIGGLVAAVFVARLYWEKIKSFFRKQAPELLSPDDEEPEDRT